MSAEPVTAKFASWSGLCIGFGDQHQVLTLFRTALILRRLRSRYDTDEKHTMLVLQLASTLVWNASPALLIENDAKFFRIRLKLFLPGQPRAYVEKAQLRDHEVFAAAPADSTSLLRLILSKITSEMVQELVQASGS